MSAPKDKTPESPAPMKVTSYVKDLLARMELWGWKVYISDEPDLENDARIATHDTRRYATLYLGFKFFEESPEDQRHTIIHELLHIHFNSTQVIVRLDVVKHVGQGTYDALYANYLRQSEFAVDALADIIAPFMPLPAGPLER